MPNSDYNSVRFRDGKQKPKDGEQGALSSETLESFDHLCESLGKALGEGQNLIVQQLLEDIQNLLWKKHELEPSLKQDSNAPKGP